MASYQDLLDVIARVGAVTGDSRAWLTGLSDTDIATITSPVNVVSPSAIDNVVAKIRAQHRAALDPAASSDQTTGVGEGLAAEAIRTAETSLAHQNSMSAQLDLQVITAVLNAHAVHSAGREALDGLQRDIETAVAARTDLDTPAGARAFQRYLIDKLRDIKTVVETAGLDATSKASLAAALASLYVGATPDAVAEDAPDARPAAATPAEPAVDVPADVGPDPFTDALLPDDLAPSAPDAAAAAQPVPAPMIPPMAGIPATGGGSGGGVPAGPSPVPPAFDNLAPARLPSTDTSDLLDDPLPDEPIDDAPIDSEPADDTGAAEEPDVPPADDSTVVTLPNGETVTAPTPQLAAAITAAVAGTPIPEAFRQQGIMIPPPGTAVSHPVEAARVLPGDIGMLTDRHALALGNGKAVLNNQIQPITSVAGPSFLGWEHPPEPGAGAITPKPDQPAPTRPAVTAGPPAIGE
ncbi:DUF4226 domain-containing protein [Mycolicibacterium aichiense]|uniref:Biofilm regulator n=1 Tax=Mycolicibacterium aichiense TaxID=1799 RepID=A0AAD1HTB1_9MYCO|nr:DUF4226 domain-containing protein [Mycolicibacterium aichiense]MCV7018729.1 DUF4226 domain-containing protein [Mycolicibacterium aichiense]BBX10795.1 hypothetical protein MAIC_55980 [Mycolicibacterium aichiense]STZ25547.1 Biofilm regulator [Mycolicibacterium aichiense]